MTLSRLGWEDVIFEQAAVDASNPDGYPAPWPKVRHAGIHKCWATSGSRIRQRSHLFVAFICRAEPMLLLPLST